MNRSNRFLLVAATLIALVSFAPSGFSGRPRPKTTPIEHHDTVISSVSPTSITINEDKTPKTFSINSFTEITFRGQRATIADLKPGMAVTVTLGMDPTSASRITANDAQIHNDPPAKGHKR